MKGMHVTTICGRRRWKDLISIRVTPLRRFLFFVVVDATLIVVATLMALWLRLEWKVPLAMLPQTLVVAGVTAGVTVAMLAASRLYMVSWSFVSLRDIGKLGLGLLLAALATLAIQLLFRDAWPFHEFPASTLLIQLPISFCALSAFRLSKRAVALVRGRHRSGSPTLILGAGAAGEQVLKSIQGQGHRTRYHVVGFLDDDPLAWATQIHGVTVLGPLSKLEEMIERYSVDVAILCVASASSEFVREIVRRCRGQGVRQVRIIPPLSQIVDGHVTVNSTREVSLEDLLGREPVSIDSAGVGACIAGKGILVTGGAGTIGSELCRQIARFSPERLVVVDVDESRLHDVGLELRRSHPTVQIVEALLDVRSAESLNDLFEVHKPAVVFHAAAYKHVPMMEAYPLAALEVNAIGTANVLAAAERHGCGRFILISTDKAVEPSSIMGASKRLAELLLFADAPAAMIRSAVRFGNVIGSRGSVIPTFERQLRDGGPLTVTHPEIERFFMMTSEAVSLVLQAAALGEGNDVFVLDMGKPVKIADVARDFVRLNGLEPDRDVQIVFTGLRPGEKLYELLSYSYEMLEPTRHARLMRTRVSIDRSRDEFLLELAGVLSARDVTRAREYLRSLFPSIGSGGDLDRTELERRTLRSTP